MPKEIKKNIPAEVQKPTKDVEVFNYILQKLKERKNPNQKVKK